MSRLDNYDIAILLDRSGSMGIEDCPNGKTRWAYARENVEAIATRTARMDKDGIDIIVFGSQIKKYLRITFDNLQNELQKIYKEVEPLGTTATDVALEALLTPKWFADRKAEKNKPLIIVVFTDGEPNDRDAVTKIIINAANSIERDADLGIVFVQIGHDASAKAYLDKLDNQLKKDGFNISDTKSVDGHVKVKFDIVDTKTMDQLDDLGIIGLLEQALDD
jgi:uncharacterized protein YegL